MNFFREKNILIISPESWGKSFLSKHHYALELAKQGNKVWFLNPPWPNNGWAYEVPPAAGGRLKVIGDKHIRGLRLLPSFMQKWIMQRQVRQLQKKERAKFDIVWSFDNSRYFHLDCFSRAFRIHHVVDHHMDYHLRQAAQSADLCLGVSEEITRQLMEFNANSHFIQHGFAPFVQTDVRLPSVEGRTKVAYVGNLLMRSFDIDLLYTLARRHTQTDFYLIGSYREGNLSVGLHTERIAQILTLNEEPNIHLCGEYAHEDAFTLARQADVQMALYFKEGETFSNSSKLPFYLFNGIVTVSNYFSMYEGSELLRMARTREEYVSLFADTLQDLEKWNSPQRCAGRRAFALGNTYDKQLERIETFILQRTK
jgi:hypothetical protein